ncbi:glutamyl-tRNA synthetase [Dipodascopsis tothii]|uniref:glutamyl-tRNA synthetase n=1 Tax=Dipodascopsis tothii TaxID=44089 RepID=UPI0034CE38D7
MSAVLTVSTSAPQVAYACLIAAAIQNDVKAGAIEIAYHTAGPLIEKEIAESTVSYTQGSAAIYGTATVLKAIAAQFPETFYKGAATADVDHWIEFASAKLGVKDFKSLTPSLDELESHLNFRSYFVGYSLTAADVAVWGALRANPVVGGAIKSRSVINVSRWYRFLEQHDARFTGAVDQLIKEMNEKRKTDKPGKQTSQANFNIGLPDAVEGQVVTRFPPEPSGYLHIGHAKAAMLNQYFAQMYKGKLIVRFDDTNPSKEKMEFQQSIIEDLELLGIKGDVITYSSDNFDHMYALAIKMIEEGKAYVDDTPVDQMRQERTDGVPSARRDRTVEENLRLFKEEMTNGTEEGLKNCLRAKISVDAPNKALRDPVIYRCNLTPHHRTGTKWKVYPTYDFCCPIIDALEGVTHALRTIEYRDRNAQYDWFLKAMNLRKVHVWDFARLNFVRTLLSKRKLQWFVDEKIVAGWDDPRFPTVRGVRRRGMSVEGLRSFILAQGPSKNIVNSEWSLIWATNKKVIDPIAPRHTAVTKENAVTVSLAHAPATPVTEERAKHKKNPAVGNKKLILADKILVEQEDAQTFKEGEEITLMDWGNAIIKTIAKEGDIVTGITADLHLDGDFRKTEKKVTWLAATPDAVPVDLVDFDYLITKDKLEEDDNFADFITPTTEFHTAAFGDVNVRDMKVGDVIQFERKGYYRLDSVATETEPAVFFTIPDGKATQKYGAKK